MNRNRKGYDLMRLQLSSLRGRTYQIQLQIPGVTYAFAHEIDMPLPMMELPDDDALSLPPPLV